MQVLRKQTFPLACSEKGSSLVTYPRARKGWNIRGECACEGWSDGWCFSLLFLSDAEDSSGAILVEFIGDVS